MSKVLFLILLLSSVETAKAQQSAAYLIENGKCIDFRKDLTGAIYADLKDCTGSAPGYILTAPSGHTFFLTRQGSGNCLVYEDDALQLRGCNDVDSLQWQYDNVRNDTIYNTKSQLCLTRDKPLISADVPVILSECKDWLSQRWTIGLP
ncbi:ricin-type beta-trefoil lectin domain protein [Rhizobium ruizarguesonis]